MSVVVQAQQGPTTGQYDARETFERIKNWSKIVDSLSGTPGSDSQIHLAREGKSLAEKELEEKARLAAENYVELIVNDNPNAPIISDTIKSNITKFKGCKEGESCRAIYMDKINSELKKQWSLGVDKIQSGASAEPIQKTEELSKAVRELQDHMHAQHKKASTEERYLEEKSALGASSVKSHANYWLKGNVVLSGE